MKLNILLPFVIGAVLAVAQCGEKKSGKAMMKEMSEKMCEKMISCMDENLKMMPDEMKKAMQKSMPTKESCVEQATAELKNEKDIMLDKEEAKLAKECMTFINSLKCSELMNLEKKKGNACDRFSAKMRQKMPKKEKQEEVLP